MSATASEVASSRSTATAPSGSWDWWLLGVVVALVALGLLMILSASSVMADQRYGDALRFVTRQLIGLGLGLGAAVSVLVIPWGWFRTGSRWILGASVVMLALVWTPLGHGANGARRWLDVGLLNLQPSEMAKVAIILFASDYLARNAHQLNRAGGLLPLLGLCGVPIVLTSIQPDFGSTVILVGLVGYLLILAGLRSSWVVLGGVATVAALSFVALLQPYRIRRLTSFVDPLENASGDGYQVVQAWIALAQGGLTGQGLGTGVAQRGFLPEAHTDFIGAVVGEELGAIGWLVMVACYGVVLWRGTTIAARANGLYGNLLAGGVTTLLTVQAIINLGVIVGWVPPKGLVLPFVSYGASAVVVHILCIGLLLRVGLESPARRTR